MTSQHAVLLIRLAAVALVIALLTSLFAATGAQAAGGSIAGKVTKPDGKAISGMAVDLYSVLDDRFTHEKSATTRSDGTYSFSSLSSSSLDWPIYVVAFGEGDGTYALEYWNNQTEMVRAARIVPKTSSISNVNATMAVGGTISGTVQRDGGAGVAEAEIAAYREGDGNDLEYETSAFSAEDGSYALRGLLPGRYRVEFNPPTDGPDAELAMEYWDNKRSVEDSTEISVSTGEAASGINALLDMGGAREWQDHGAGG